eukprot:1480095-Rhodomonas_salina.2
MTSGSSINTQQHVQAKEQGQTHHRAMYPADFVFEEDCDDAEKSAGGQPGCKLDKHCRLPPNDDDDDGDDDDGDGDHDGDNNRETLYQCRAHVCHFGIEKSVPCYRVKGRHAPLGRRCCHKFDKEVRSQGVWGGGFRVLDLRSQGEGFRVWGGGFRVP